MLKWKCKKERKNHTDLNQLSFPFHVNLQLHFHIFTTLFSAKTKTLNVTISHCPSFHSSSTSYQRPGPFIHLSIHLFVIHIKIFKPHHSPGCDISHPSFEFLVAGARTHLVYFCFSVCEMLCISHQEVSLTAVGVANILSVQHLCSFLYVWWAQTGLKIASHSRYKTADTTDTWIYVTVTDWCSV